MKIALVGYGKMGKIIDEIATKRGHEVVARLNETPTKENLNNPDVVIEFSQPEVAFSNIKTCLENKIPVVCGTTGWLEQKPAIEKIALENGTGFLYGSNFSLGVNLFFELNEYLAKIMSKFDNYTVDMEEIHHTQKLDAPSGTAISLAKGVIENSSYTNWTLDQPKKDQIHIEAKRIGMVPGTHTVTYNSAVDAIEIKHTAHNREGFALGAVIAAEWIIGKKGVFTMKDVLELDK